MRLIDADALIEFCAERWIPLNVDAVNMQPTIQPVATDTNVGDIISRQAAIDAAKHAWAKGLEPSQYIEIIPSAQPEQRWIPCSKQLPKHGGRYLVSVLDGIERRTTVAPYLPRCKAWTMTGRMAYWKVIAWTPLPEPWKEGETNDDEM